MQRQKGKCHILLSVPGRHFGCQKFGTPEGSIQNLKSFTCKINEDQIVIDLCTKEKSSSVRKLKCYLQSRVKIEKEN